MRIEIGRGLLWVAVLALAGCISQHGPRPPRSPETPLGTCDGDMVRGLFADADPAGEPPQIRALVVRFAGTNDLAKQFGMRVGSTLSNKFSQYARQALDMEHSGLTAASLRVKFVPCVISDHEHARAIGRVAGADVVMWGQTFCNWRQPGPCQSVELYLEGANRSNTIHGSPNATLTNSINLHAPPDTEAETEYTTSLTVVRWVGLEVDGASGEPMRGRHQLAAVDLPQLTSPRAKLLLDFVLGLYAYRAGRYALAADFFQRSQASIVAAGVEGVPDLYRIMGTSYVIAGQTEVGLYALKKAFVSCPAPKPSCLAAGLNSLGWAMDHLDNPREAMKYYLQSLPLDRQAGNHEAEAATLNNLGLVYQKLGDRKKALEFCERALPLTRQTSCQKDEAATLNNLGTLHDDAGDTKKAVAFYEQALLLRRKIGDLDGQAYTLHNLGTLYQHQAPTNPQLALELYQQALRLWWQVGDSAGEASTFHSLDAVFKALGDPRKTLEFFQQISVVRPRPCAATGAGFLLDRVAFALRELGQPEEAMTKFQEAAAAYLRCTPKGDRAARRSFSRAFRLALHNRLWSQATAVVAAMEMAYPSTPLLAVLRAQLLREKGSPEAGPAYQRLQKQLASWPTDQQRELRPVIQAGQTRLLNRMRWPGCPGAVVTALNSPGQAPQLGLRVGDILLHYQGTCLHDPDDLDTPASRVADSDLGVLELWRDDAPVKLHVTGNWQGIAVESF